MAAESAVVWVKEMTNPLRFRNLNSSHMTISTHIHYFYIKKKLDEICFFSFRAAIFVHLRDFYGGVTVKTSKS